MGVLTVGKFVGQKEGEAIFYDGSRELKIVMYAVHPDAKLGEEFRIEANLDMNLIDYNARNEPKESRSAARAEFTALEFQPYFHEMYNQFAEKFREVGDG